MVIRRKFNSKDISQWTCDSVRAKIISGLSNKCPLISWSIQKIVCLSQGWDDSHVCIIPSRVSGRGYKICPVCPSVSTLTAEPFVIETIAPSVDSYFFAWGDTYIMGGRSMGQEYRLGGHEAGGPSMPRRFHYAWFCQLHVKVSYPLVWTKSLTSKPSYGWSTLPDIG